MVRSGCAADLLAELRHEAAEVQRDQQRQPQRNEDDNQRIDHQPFEAGPEGVGAVVMVRQQGEHAGKVVAAGANLDHLAVKVRQGAPGQGFLERGAAGEVGFQLLDLGPQRARAHPGAQLLERPFQRDALAEHRRQLLVEEGKFVVVHAISLKRASSVGFDRAGGESSRGSKQIVAAMGRRLCPARLSPNTEAEIRKKAERRSPKPAAHLQPPERDDPGCSSRLASGPESESLREQTVPSSDFGSRPSFGLRYSGFGFPSRALARFGRLRSSRRADGHRAYRQAAAPTNPSTLATSASVVSPACTSDRALSARAGRAARPSRSRAAMRRRRASLRRSHSTRGSRPR